MTNHPRFRLIDDEPGQRHRHYHGAPVVDLAFRLADWWLSLRKRHPNTRSRALAVADWKPGAAIFISGAAFQSDGTLVAQVMVEPRRPFRVP